MRKKRTKEELEIIKNDLEYELIEIVDANTQHYTESFTDEMDDEMEIEKFEKKCENFYKKDLQCLFDILITNHFDYLINKYDLVVENNEVDFELITPIYTEYMTKYLDDKLYEIEDSEMNHVYSQFILDDVARYYSEIRDFKLSLLRIED
jgi:hypothetical protein